MEAEQSSDARTMGENLREPFPATDIEWRIGQCGKHGNGIWAMVLAYVTNRAIMQRLDDVVGPGNWHNEYRPGPDKGVVCGISIRINGEWVTKWDGAENTQVESVKGGLSDSMKRAAVQWGIGRYLYKLEESFLPSKCISTDKVSGWRRAKAKVRDKPDETFYWTPPDLPAWALPEGAATKEPAEKPAKKATKKTEPAENGFDWSGHVRTILQDEVKCGRANADAVVQWVSNGMFQHASELNDQRAAEIFAKAMEKKREKISFDQFVDAAKSGAPA